MSTLDSRGREVVSSEPIAVPVGFKRPETLAEQIRRMVRSELSASAADQGFETFEEADDFDIEDDYGDPTDSGSKWELSDEHQSAPRKPGENGKFIEESPDSGGPGPEPRQESEPDSSDRKSAKSTEGEDHYSNDGTRRTGESKAVKGAKGGAKSTPKRAPPPDTEES